MYRGRLAADFTEAEFFNWHWTLLGQDAIRKTCHKGLHYLDGDNFPLKRRRCRACENERQRRWQRDHRKAKAA